MIETKLTFSIDIGDVLDIDFSPNGDLVSLQGYGKRQVVCFPDRIVELPAIWANPSYPHMRSLGGDRWLFVDTHADVIGDNALVVNEAGKLISQFHLGAGVLDVCNTAGNIAASYHIDAAYEFGFNPDPLAAVGVAIFNQNGRIIACLNHDLERLGFRAENIQCMVPRESGELLIVPDTLSGPDVELQSPLVFYDWRMGHVRWEENEFTQPIAVSSRGKNLYIYSPADSEENLLQTDLNGRNHRTLGFHKNIYRGLSGGRFISQISPTEYLVLEAATELQKSPEPATTLLLRQP